MRFIIFTLLTGCISSNKSQVLEITQEYVAVSSCAKELKRNITYSPQIANIVNQKIIKFCKCYLHKSGMEPDIFIEYFSKDNTHSRTETTESNWCIKNL